MPHFPGRGPLKVCVRQGRELMKELRYQDADSLISARAHLLIWSAEEPRKLIAAGLVDVDSAARGLAARITTGENLRVYSSHQSWSLEFMIKSDKYGYRIVTKTIGKLAHVMVLHKSAVDEQLPEDSIRTLLVPDGGDVADLFLRRFANDFNLPYVPEWKTVVWQTCQQKKLVRSLNVWTDPKVGSWKNVSAFAMEPALDEERAKHVLSGLLRQKFISLPKGITDAPPLFEALQAETMDPQTGESTGPTVIDYLQTYAPHLATTIEDLAMPAHDLDQAIDPAIAQMARVPFPAQAHAAQAALKGLKQSKAVFIASDMGTGKSIISLAVIHAMSKAQKSAKGFATLMLVPGTTIPKWVRDEIGKTLPEAKVTIWDSWHDVIKYRDEKVLSEKKEPLEFVLISRDSSKLGMPEGPALIYKERWVLPDKPQSAKQVQTAKIIKNVWLCPVCGGVQQKHNKTAEKNAKTRYTDVDAILERKLGFFDLAKGSLPYVTEGIEHQRRERVQYLWRPTVHRYHCTECGANLTRSILPDREQVPGMKHRRMQPAWLVQKYLNGWFDLLVVDELQQYKATSGQGEAMGVLAGACRRVLGLTGTLTDGKASSLFHILWRVAPKELLAEGIDHKGLNRFVNRYGTLEQRGRYGEDKVSQTGTVTRGKLILNPPKEIPGLSPRLFVNHLADKCVFLELGDMGLPLVELEERPVFVKMDEEEITHYQDFHSELEAVMKWAYASHNHAAFAKFIPAVVNAANQPHLPQRVEISDTLVEFLPLHDASVLSAEEQQLVEDIQAEKEQHRRCVVYTRFSGNWGQNQRIAEVLRRNGIRVKVLQTSVASEERVEWLEQAVREDVDVVIANAKLVEVGLDLIDFPTLMFYQFTDEVSTMRQAARRAWRIGQYRACKVLYYVYKDTYEVVQFQRMLTKRSHALLLEGRLDKSEVAQFAPKDANSASTFAIASCLGDVEDLAAKWKSLADKDIPSGVLMLEEGRFRLEIQDAMKRLASETRRIAGVLEPATISNDIEVPLANVPEPGEVIDLPLFAMAEDVDVSTSPTEPEPVVPTTPLTVGDLRKQMGMVEKAKRTKKKDQVGDDQVLLFAI